MIRLLKSTTDGNLALCEFDSFQLPPYAVLSHTWNSDNSKEVSFADLEAGAAKSKPGYRKILFCAERAAADGL
jgi:hypothetical protein